MARNPLRREFFSESAAIGAAAKSIFVPRRGALQCNLRSCLPVFTIVMVSAVLAACGSSETRSLVSTQDIPASKYRKVILFIENTTPQEQREAERVFVAALKQRGINSTGSAEFFATNPKLSDAAKAALVRKHGFDAAMYVAVLEKNVVEERVPNTWHDGQMIHSSIFGLITVSHDIAGSYIPKQDGSVYQPLLALKLKAELQDVNSGKHVWVAETVATGPAAANNMSLLFTQASNQVADKLRTDQAI